MRKDFTLYIFCFWVLSFSLFTVYSSFGQWVVQNGGANAALSSVSFPDSLHGWAVGQSGTILKTTNGGKTWITENSGTSNPSVNYFISVFFTDTLNGWIAGGYSSINLSSEEILKYENKKWVTQINIWNTAGLNSVYLKDINHGLAVGEQGEIIKYNGKQWISQASGTVSPLNSVFMTDSNKAWAVGNNGTILKYDGKQWKIEHSGSFGNILVDLYSVYFIDSTKGWAVGYSLGYYGVILKYEKNKWTINQENASWSLSSVFFTDSINGWVVGDRGTNGLILKYDGKQWKYQNSNSKSSLYSVSFSDPKNGWAVGYEVILHTKNGGFTPYLTSGQVTYDNIYNTPIINSKLYAINSEGIVEDSVTTDSSGAYKFTKLIDGNYTIKILPIQEWGGADATDAFLTNRYYVKDYSFQDTLMHRAAEVNLDNKIFPVDAYLINKRYLKLIHSFRAGDWLIDKPKITINDKNIIGNNIKIICTGDVNGSYIPK